MFFPFLFLAEMSALAGVLVEQKNDALLRVALEEQNNFMTKFIYTWVPQTCLIKLMATAIMAEQPA